MSFLGHPQGRRHEGTEEFKFSVKGGSSRSQSSMETGSSQAGDIWDGQCPAILGKAGRDQPAPAVLHLCTCGLTSPGAWLLHHENAPTVAVAICLFLLSIGVPLSWKKALLAEVSTWFRIRNPIGPMFLVAKIKHVLVMEVLHHLAEGKVMSASQIASALGQNLSYSPSGHGRRLARPPTNFRSWSFCVPSCFCRFFWQHFCQAPPFALSSEWHGMSDASAIWPGICRWLALVQREAGEGRLFLVPLQDRPLGPPMGFREG